ncbi:MAG: M28 family peptidase [Vicinamibacterales bacterium]
MSTTLESTLRSALSLDEPLALIDRFQTLTRESGTPDERTAAEYIVSRLRALGVPVDVLEPTIYLSNPERAEVRVRTADGEFEVRARPPAFSFPTNGADVTGELCYVPSKYAGGTASLFDTADAARGAAGGIDPVAGKIVLTEGFSMPGNVSAFERRGAIGQIFIHPGRDIHEGICTSIWGMPTAESIARKPKVPVVCINHPDGERLIALAERGRPQVSLRTWLREGWFPCLLPVVDIKGTEDPDEFLLVHGHYDSWYVGIGDNATGDATLLELARVLHGVRAELKRSVRIAWWPGHSTGRYAGSTWFADAFADEIDEHCIAQLNIDSPGCAGATVYDEVMWMAEAGELCRNAIRDAVAVEPKGMRPLRAGDYSFNQIGPTGFYMLLSNIPAAERAARGFYAVGGCGGNIAWHTPHDLMDVADAGIMRRDLEVYVTTIARVLNSPLHPFDYRATVDEIAAAVTTYRDAAKAFVRLDPILDDLATLRRQLSAWYEGAARTLALSSDDATRRALNATLRRVARVLVPLNYAKGERFDHDPATKFPAVPRLEAAAQIALAPPDVQPFIAAGLIRERNKIRAMLRDVSRQLDR